MTFKGITIIRKSSPKKMTQTLFSTSKKTLCYLRMFLFNHQRELTNCTSKKFDICFFQSHHHQIHQPWKPTNPPSSSIRGLHPNAMQRNQWKFHLLLPPGVTSSFAFRLVRPAFFAPLLGLQRGAAAAAGAAGRRWQRWWPADAVGGGGAVKGTGRDGRDGHLA